jgi:DNA invertase Pin-like site-specific DNA recombinase/uncharacterized coiled-coil protein SlyX
MKKNKAYSYVRMSTDVQLKGNSLQRQLDQSKKYALEHDLELVEEDVFHDLGVSAFRSNNVTNGALGRFLDAVNSGGIEPGSVLLVESLDRLSRDQMAPAVNLFMGIVAAGVKIVTLIDNQEYAKDSLDHMKLIYSILIMARAHEESTAKSHRIAAAWNAKRQALEKSDTKLTKMCPHWLRLSDDRSEFLPIPERVKIVQRIFSDATNGLGVGLIAKRLNEQQVPCWGRTNGWRDSYIKKLLSNRAVLGEFTPHTSKSGERAPVGTFSNYYPKVISEEAFFKAEQARLSRRGAGGRRGKQIANIFSGFVRCGYCGAPAHMKDGGARNGKYLVCDKGRRALGCYSNGFPYDSLEKTFFEVVPEIDIVQIFANDTHQHELRRLQADHDKASLEINKVENGIQNLTQAIEAGSQAPVSIIKRLIELEVQLKELEAQKSQLNDQLAVVTSQIFNASEYQTEVKHLVAKMDTLKGDERLAIRAKIQQRIRGLIKTITLYPLGRVTDKFLKQMQTFMDGQGESDKTLMKRVLAAAQTSGKQRCYSIHFNSKRVLIVTPDAKLENQTIFVWDTDQV